MSVQRLRDRATEGSTKVITATFKDDVGNLAVPNNMYWTLSDRFGNIINSRKSVDYEVDDGAGSVGILTSAMAVVINGKDLDIASAALSKEIVLTIEGTYDSNNGTDLPYKAQCMVPISNLVAFRRYYLVPEAAIFSVRGYSATFTVA